MSNVEDKRVCRLCLHNDQDEERENGNGFYNIFGTQIKSEEFLQENPTFCNFDLLKMIEEFTTIKILEDDTLPKEICSKCYNALLFICDFRSKCLASENYLKNQEQQMDDIEITVEISNDGLLIHEIKCEIKPEQYKEDVSSSSNTNKQRSSSKILTYKNNRTSCKRRSSSQRIKRKTIKRNKLEKIKNDSSTKYLIPTVPCEICGKLIQIYGMKYHLNMHNDIRPYKCNIDNCKKSFTSPTVLAKHNRVVHLNVKRYKCEICDKKFGAHSTYVQHKTSHGDPKFPCKICGKMLRNNRSVKKHMLVHTGERPYPCIECTKAFQTIYNLKVHQRVHTKEKSFVCCKCGEAFGYNSLLKMHTEKYH